MVEVTFLIAETSCVISNDLDAEPVAADYFYDAVASYDC